MPLLDVKKTGNSSMPTKTKKVSNKRKAPPSDGTLEKKRKTKQTQLSSGKGTDKEAKRLFAAKKRAELKKTNPEADAATIKALLKKAWGELSLEQRSSYSGMSQKKSATTIADKKAQAPKRKAPKGARSAYNFFCVQRRQELKANGEEIKGGDLFKRLSEDWKALPEEGKQPFNTQALEDKKRRAEEMKHYTPDEQPKKKRKKDPNAPKRGKSAYMFFCAETRPQLAGTVSTRDVMKELGAKWKQLSVEDKAPYEKQAAADKIRYQEEMKTYIPPPDMSPQAPSKKRKDPNAPKRAKTAYVFFCAQHRTELQKEGKSLGEVSKTLGQMWKTKTAEEKAPFVEKAAQDKDRYSKELNAFKLASNPAATPGAKKTKASPAPIPEFQLPDMDGETVGAASETGPSSPAPSSPHSEESPEEESSEEDL